MVIFRLKQCINARADSQMATIIKGAGNNDPILGNDTAGGTEETSSERCWNNVGMENEWHNRTSYLLPYLTFKCQQSIPSLSLMHAFSRMGCPWQDHGLRLTSIADDCKHPTPYAVPVEAFLRRSRRRRAPVGPLQTDYRG